MGKKIDNAMAKLEDARLPELRAKYEEVIGEPTRAPNRTYLLRRIREGLEARERASRERRGGRRARSSRAGRATERLSELSVADLQARYLEEVGRATASVNKNYLVWKIRMARAGKVRVGPARERKHEPGDTQVVPLTLPRGAVAALDEVVERTTFGNRSAFLRRAIHDLLRGQGFASVATEHFGEA